MYHRGFTLFNVLVYHIVFDVDVLGSMSYDRVLCQVNSTLIVTMEQDGFFFFFFFKKKGKQLHH